MSTIIATTRISDTERAAWIVWCRRLGIDPNDVAVPGFIARELSERRVCWEGYVRDAEGHLQLDVFGEAAARVDRFVQLEAEPPPFPAEAIHTLAVDPADLLMIMWEDRS